MNDLHERLSSALSERYELDREIGRGGMAVVYLATDLKQGRQVALKVFQPDIAAAMGPARFRREIEIATRLEHPHILSLYDSGEAEGLLYYVMPYVKEESLRQRLDREGQLPIEDALRIAREMAEALDYAHDQGVVHRDVKPGNVLLQRGHALLADFGVARALEEAGGDRLTKTGVSVGTPYYMAPEQVTGADSVDGRADVYAVGAVLYEMLTGETPYMGSTPQAVLAKRMAGPPTPIPVLRETVGPEVDGVVQQAMARSPADRWQSAADLAKALAVAERGGGTPIPGLVTRPGVTTEFAAVGAKPNRRRRWVAPAVVAVAVAGLALAGVWYSGQRTGGEGATATNLPEPDPMLVFITPERPADLEGDVWTRLLGDRVKNLGDLEIVPLTDALFDLREFSVLPTRVADSVAATFAAGKLMMVNSTEIGDGLRLNVSLRATGDASTVLAEVDTTVSKSDHQDWAPAVVVRLFENQETGLTRDANLAALNRGSVHPEAEIEASKGAAYWGRGQYDSAMIAYQRAVDIDSTYVEAWRGLSWSAGFSAPGNLPFDHDSVRFHNEVAQLAQERFEALGGVVESLILPLNEARRQVELQPGSPDAQWDLYVTMLREYWKRGWEPDSVLGPLLTSIDLDPHASYKRFRLIVFHTYMGNPEGIRDVLADASSFDVNALPAQEVWPAVSMLSLGTEEQVDSVLAALPRESMTMNIVSTKLFQVQDDMDLTARFAELAYSPGWAPVWLVRYNMAGGQWSEAIKSIELDDNEQARFAHTVAARACMAGSGVLHLPEATIRESRDSALAVSPGEEVEAVQRLHCLGLMSAQLSDRGQAQAYADSLDAFAVDIGERSVPGIESDANTAELATMATDAALEVRALDARLTGRSEEALNLLEAQDFEPFPGSIDFHWVVNRTYGRFLRAEVLHDLGRFEEAVGWYATIPRLSMGIHLETLLFAPVFHSRARALDALGRHEEALHYYRRFATRWQDADPHLQPQVEEARQRIRELEAELN